MWRNSPLPFLLIYWFISIMTFDDSTGLQRSERNTGKLKSIRAWKECYILMKEKYVYKSNWKYSERIFFEQYIKILWKTSPNKGRTGILHWIVLSKTIGRHSPEEPAVRRKGNWCIMGKFRLRMPHQSIAWGRETLYWEQIVH